MPSRYSEENLDVTSSAYRVFRELAISEDGSYASEMEDKVDLNRSDITRQLRIMQEMNIVKQGKRGKAQYYIPDYAGISELQMEMLDLDVPLEALYLEVYVRRYCGHVKDSTIRTMLREDFVSIFQGYSRYNELPEPFEDVLDQASTGFDKGFMEIAEDVVEEVEPTEDQ